MPYPVAAVHGRTTVASGAASLTLPIGLPLSDTTAYVGWSSTSAAGTVYWVVSTSATPPSAGQIKAGQSSSGAAAAAAGSQAAGVGAQAATATGLASPNHSATSTAPAPGGCTGRLRV